MNIKKVCVFCGASYNGDQEIDNSINDLSSFIAKNKQSLVYGGGNIGIMGKLANACMDKGAKVYGVIPEFLLTKEVGHCEITELFVVKNMHERKKKMSDLSDAFIVMPGGFGTLEEFFEVLTWLQLGLHAKPIGLLNVGGFYDMLIAHIDVMIERGLLKPQYRELVIVDSKVASLMEKMEVFANSNLDSWTLEKKLA